jgi:hypothetical protein
VRLVLDRDLAGDSPGGFPEMLGRFIEEMERDTARLDAEIAASRAAYEDADEQRAEDARAGKLGREWQVLQRRIDAGETSALAVLTGDDPSPEARSLRELSMRNLQNMRAEWDMRADVEDEDEKPEDRPPHVQARGAARESHEHFERISAQIAEMIRHAQNGGLR